MRATQDGPRWTGKGGIFTAVALGRYGTKLLVAIMLGSAVAGSQAADKTIESQADIFRRRYGVNAGPRGSGSAIEVEDLRMVEGKIYHLHVLAAWRKSDQKQPRPLPAWDFYQGRVAGQIGNATVIGLPATRADGELLVRNEAFVAVRNLAFERFSVGRMVEYFAMRIPGRFVQTSDYGLIPVFDFGRPLSPKETDEYLARSANTNRQSGGQSKQPR